MFQVDPSEAPAGGSRRRTAEDPCVKGRRLVRGGAGAETGSGDRFRGGGSGNRLGEPGRHAVGSASGGLGAGAEGSGVGRPVRAPPVRARDRFRAQITVFEGGSGSLFRGGGPGPRPRGHAARPGRFRYHVVEALLAFRFLDLELSEPLGKGGPALRVLGSLLDPAQALLGITNGAIALSLFSLRRRSTAARAGEISVPGGPSRRAQAPGAIPAAEARRAAAAPGGSGWP